MEHAKRRIRDAGEGSGSQELSECQSHNCSSHLPPPQGLAHCFEKEDGGKLSDRWLIEPITANALECMANGTRCFPAPCPRVCGMLFSLFLLHTTGAKTCYRHVYSLTLGEVLPRSKATLPREFAEGLFCEDFEARADAAARTWMRPHALDNLL